MGRLNINYHCNIRGMYTTAINKRKFYNIINIIDINKQIYYGDSDINIKR